ncbi:MAG TPA: hypothetical protein VFD59_08335 [Nocardioidaceae bacterium]|nr:hypothetical protein [Nocardioidaceae bacterium]
MENKDVLMIDELQTMRKGDWLLPFMTEGRLLTDAGPIACPDITIVGATTDAGVLPQTVLTRFMCKPKLVPYTNAEAALLVQNLALRMNVVVTDVEAPKIARAASGNPRDMRSILTSIRDLQFALPGTEVDLAKAFSWAGFTHDGLTQLAQDMILVLSQQPNLTASIESLHSLLGEPGPLKHPEQMLLQRGFTTITGRGRQLTNAGVARVRELARGN